MQSTATGKGYWLCATDGGIFTFGDAHYHGSKVKTTAPVVNMARTTSGNGYWICARDGTVANYGDAAKLGNGGMTSAVLVRS